ncbi:vetispiradiene synthase 3-like [Apium graveolens]|uniref:vetispiradiene synthase 3-like n=1 Tax=Apium graveolens TaxID=4045 RepID=UPI003D7AA554
MAVSSAPASLNNPTRPLVSFSPSLYGNRFSSFRADYEMYLKTIEPVSSVKHLQPTRGNFHNLSSQEHIIYFKLFCRQTNSSCSFYGEDPMKNEKLLRGAKLDFNLLMMIHKEELCQLTRWLEELDLATKLPYVRKRMFENYFWAVSIFFEPCYSLGRIFFTKMVEILAITDGTYDTPMQFVPSYMDQLPDYVQICYKILLDTFKEFSDEMSKHGRLYIFKMTVRAYYLEAKWLNQDYVAPFEEYLANGAVSTGCNMLCFATFMGINTEDATVEACDWVKSPSKIVQALALNGRLYNDLRNYEDEKNREHVATSVRCYMKEHGVTVEEACSEIVRRIENAWKDANESLLKPTPVSMEVLRRPLNMIRMVHVTYKHEDGYTHPHNIKEDVAAMLIDPVPI